MRQSGKARTTVQHQHDKKQSIKVTMVPGTTRKKQPCKNSSSNKNNRKNNRKKKKIGVHWNINCSISFCTAGYHGH